MNVNRAIMGWYFVGVERAELMGEFDPAVFAWPKKVALRLRYLERVPLGTPYPDIVERVRRTTRAPELDGRCHVAVDATGVGRRRAGARVTTGCRNGTW
jgi:hypothetical protein